MGNTNNRTLWIIGNEKVGRMVFFVSFIMIVARNLIGGSLARRILQGESPCREEKDSNVAP